MGSLKSTTAAVLALLLSACGGTSPTAPPPGAGSIASPATTTAAVGSDPLASGSRAPATGGDLDHCSLLTDSEIEAATGYEVVGSDTDPLGISDCVWRLGGQGGIGVRVELDSSRAQQDHEFECADVFGLDPVQDVGDSACGGPGAGGTYALHALRGNDQVALRMDGNYDIDESAYRTLARSVIAKLP